MQSNGAWWNYAWGYVTEAPPLPVWPNPAMLAVFLTDNRLIQIIVLLLMSTWWFGWAGTLFLSSTRVIFAAAFDRLLPEKAAELNKNGTPVNAMLLMVVPAIIVSAMYAYNVAGFQVHHACGDPGHCDHVFWHSDRGDHPAVQKEGAL